MPAIDIEALIDRQRAVRMVTLVLVWAALAMAVDGYDMMSISYAAPYMIDSWHVTRGAFGASFSVGGIGQICGGIIFGMIADALGRKPAIVLGALVLGLSTLATVLATDLEQLVWLRLLAGVGVGGVAPVAIVLVNEYAPRHLRATMVAIMYIGYTAGGAAAGLVSAVAMESFGWQAIFWVGGLAPLAIAAILLVLLPESIRFLAVRKPNSPALPRLVRRLAPELTVGPQTRFVVHEQRAAKVPFRLLFADGRYVVTLLFWAAYFFNSLTLFTMSSWSPTILEALGLGKSQAALTASLFGIFGSAAGILITWLIDRRGIAAMVLPPLIGVPTLILMAYLGGAPLAALMAASWIAGMAVSGGQTGLHATGAILYPTAIRANGVAFGLLSSRTGGVVAPFIAGLLFTNGPGGVRLVLILSALPLLVVAACFAGLSRAQGRRAPEPLPVTP